MVKANVVVQSSFISSIGYDERDKTLNVRMGNDEYAYFEVSVAVAFAFAASTSKGKYYTKEIRGKFASAKIAYLNQI